MKKLFFLLLLFAIAYLPTTAQRSDEVKKVIDRYLEATGGEKKWREISSLYQEITFIKFASSYSAKQLLDSSNMLIYVKKPSQYKQVITEKEKVSILALDGDIFWTKHQGKPVIQPKDHADYIRSTMVSVGPTDYFMDSMVKVDFLGEKELAGKNYHVLRGKSKDLDFYHDYYFDQNTGLLHCSISTHANVASYYKDYQWIDGLLFSCLSEFYDKNGELSSVSLYRKTKVNSTLDDAIFKYPIE